VKFEFYYNISCYILEMDEVPRCCDFLNFRNTVVVRTHQKKKRLFPCSRKSHGVKLFDIHERLSAVRAANLVCKLDQHEGRKNSGGSRSLELGSRRRRHVAMHGWVANRPSVWPSMDGILRGSAASRRPPTCPLGRALAVILNQVTAHTRTLRGHLVCLS
jgi:hypothetical protein